MASSVQAIQLGTILLAVATFFGAMVGALVQVGLNWWRRKSHRRNLRIALREEISQLPNAADADQIEALYTFSSGALPTPVFDANTEEIGNLTEEEVSYIIPFYMVVRLMSKLPESELDQEDVQSVFDIEDIPLGEDVEIYRQKAIRAIERNL